MGGRKKARDCRGGSTVGRRLLPGTQAGGAPFKPSEGKTPMESQSARRCYMCKQTGHVAKDCPSRKSEGVAAGKSGKELEPNGGGARQPVPVFREKRDWTKVECFNSGKRGRGSRYCPNNALFCAGHGRKKLEKEMQRSGVVNGQKVQDIVLDTGCSQTMVHSSLIPSDQLLEGDGVVVRCVHGDAAVYPLCKVRIELEGHSIQVVAAVSETLPTSVLLGTDARELGDLLGMKMPQGTLSPVEQQAYVTTRARGAAEASREREERSNEEHSGVNPNPVVMTTETEVWGLGESVGGGYFRRRCL